MKKKLLLILIILNSCNSNSEKLESHFNSHQEILNVFIDIINDDNIVGYQKTDGLVTTSYKLVEGENEVKLTVAERNFRPRYAYGDESEVKALSYRGEFDIIRKNEPTLAGYINFHLPEGQLVTPENIIEYNRYYDDNEYLTVRTNGGGNYSELRNSHNILNNNGHMLLMDEFIHPEGGMKTGVLKINIGDIIKDTIAYSKIVDMKYDGRYFKRDFFKANGDIIKYYANESVYKNGIVIERTERINGIVSSYEKNIYNENRINKKSLETKINYDVNHFYLDSDVGVVRKTGYMGNQYPFSPVTDYIWKNPIKYNIEVDEKGYHSYTPLIKDKTTRDYEYVQNDDYQADDLSEIRSYESYTAKNAVPLANLKTDVNGKWVYDYGYYLAEPKESFKSKSWEIMEKSQEISLNSGLNFLNGDFIRNDYSNQFFVNAKFDNGILLSLEVKNYEEDSYTICEPKYYGDSSCYFLKNVTTLIENKIVTKKYNKKGEIIGEDETLLNDVTFDNSSFEGIIYNLPPY